MFLRISAFPIIIFGCFLVSCNLEKNENFFKVDSDNIYFHYQITGEENKENVHCYFQFRTGGPNGTSLAFHEPGSVKLDGVSLKPDSTSFTGIFYEIMKPAVSFSGTHILQVVSMSGKEYTDSFTYKPFSFVDSMPVVVKIADQTIKLKGLDKIDYVRLIATDTSFNSPDINKVDTIKNGNLIISAKRFGKIVKGPINFQLIKEKEIISSKSEGFRGKINISYGLKRNFLLVEQ